MEGITGRIFDRLVSQYGRDLIFRDIDSVPAGTDFREHVRQMLTTTDVLLVIVGPKWTGTRRGGGARINEETDLVRIEVATGLTNGMVVIPILVGDTKMPADDLPPSLRDFAFRNAMRVDPGVDFDQHMQRLIRAIDGLLAQRAAAPPAAEPPPQPATPPRAVAASPGAPSAPKAQAVANPQPTPPAPVAVPRRSARRWLVRAAAGLAALIAVIWTIAWIGQTVAHLEAEIAALSSRLEATRTEFADALARQTGLTSADLKRLGEATTYIKNEWYLHDHVTRKLLYHRMTRIDGELLPCFVKLDDGTVVRWLTLDDQNGVNKPIGVNQGGSGFVVTEEGFILTNRRYAAGWTMAYDDGPRNGPWRGAVFAGVKGDQPAPAAEVRDMSQERALAKWIPGNGGYVFDAARPAPISAGPRQFFGQNDLLTAQFPGTRLSINGHLLRVPAADVDVALIKVDTTQAVSKLELDDLDDANVAVSDKVYMFSYEPSQQEIVYSPVLTEGTVISMPYKDGGSFQFESITSPRSGGGPVLDKRGRVMAILLAPGGEGHGAYAVALGGYLRELFQPQRNASP